MLNPIVEEAMTNMIRRIEALEEFNKKHYLNQNIPKQYNQNPGQATPGQIKYIKALGGNVAEGMTKADAGKEIDRLLAIKEEGKFEEEIQENVDEPEEVNTDDAGLDDQGLM